MFKLLYANQDMIIDDSYWATIIDISIIYVDDESTLDSICSGTICLNHWFESIIERRHITSSAHTRMVNTPRQDPLYYSDLDMNYEVQNGAFSRTQNMFYEVHAYFAYINLDTGGYITLMHKIVTWYIWLIYLQYFLYVWGIFKRDNVSVTMIFLVMAN